MIICGDLSSPNSSCTEALVKAMKETKIFQDEVVLLNLEGVLKPEVPQDTFWKVYNHGSVIDLKSTCKKLIFSLANNHTYDYPEEIDITRKLLDENGIGYCGLMEGSSIKPFEFSDGDKEYAIFAHCWRLYTKTNPNTKTSHRVCDVLYSQLYQTVKQYIENNPQKKVIVFPHWNFDLEKKPLPAYKRLAHDLIDLGVYAVIGNHTHCTQEYEIYKGHIIAYSLGNFYMPDGYFFNGKLCYPEESHKMFVLEICEDGSGRFFIHEFLTDVDKGIKLQGSEQISPEAIVSDRDYLKCYKNERTKSRLVPVFKDYQDNISNYAKFQFLVLKLNAIRKITMALDKI